MNKYMVEAAHVINMYMWDKLREHLPDYWKPIRGMSAIIPAQQQPEMTESGQNYMTYIYMDQSSRDLYVLQYQNVDWIIYSPDPSVISATIALARDLFGKYDDSAREINEWMQTAKFPAVAEDFFKRYIFKQVTVSGTTSSQPATDEGGTMDGLISVTYSFVERTS